MGQTSSLPNPSVAGEEPPGHQNPHNQDSLGASRATEVPSLDRVRSSLASRISVSVDPTAEGVRRASELGLEYAELGPLEGGGSASQGVDRGDVTDLGAVLSSCQILLGSMHAPFVGEYDFGQLDEGRREAALRLHARQLGYCSDLGVKYYVVHPGGMIYGKWDDKRKVGLWPHDRSFSQKLWRINSRMLRSLAKSASDSGIKVCLENVWFNDASFMTGEDFKGIIEESGCDGVGACVDVGHANIGAKARPSELLRLLGPLVWTVHLSDNDGSADLHLPLGRGNIDWGDVIRSLAEISYAGTLNLETEPAEGVASLRRLLA